MSDALVSVWIATLFTVKCLQLNQAQDLICLKFTELICKQAFNKTRKPLWLWNLQK